MTVKTAMQHQVFTAVGRLLLRISALLTVRTILYGDREISEIRKGPEERRVDCIFCRISEGKAAAEFVVNDGDVFAIRDVHPAAPTHILIIPKKHIPSLADLNSPEDSALISQLVSTAVKVAEKVSLSGRGYRLVWNCRAEGGQTIDHIHLHLLGGRQMKWPPG